VEQRVRAFHVGTAPPAVSHLLSAERIEELNAEFFTRAAAQPLSNDHIVN
jgi:hypothetical protein